MRTGYIYSLTDPSTNKIRYYGIDCSHIVRVCNGKSKSGITHGIAFQYYNKNKYDK
jgi:exo-beta-1,3-glucanase (GH17 family)